MRLSLRSIEDSDSNPTVKTCFIYCNLCMIDQSRSTVQAHNKIKLPSCQRRYESAVERNPVCKQL